jgi:hypothetical protein
MKLKLTVLPIRIRGDELRGKPRRVDERPHAPAVVERRFIRIWLLWQAVDVQENIEGRADQGTAVLSLGEQETVDVGGDDSDDCIEDFLIGAGSDEGAELLRQTKLLRNSRICSCKKMR